MESIFRFIIYLLLTLTTLSCNVSEIETELNIPYKGDFLILHGFICQSEGVSLILQKTVAHSCTKCSDSVSNAVVSLFENGVYLFDLNTNDGYKYHSPLTFSPTMGNEYHIKAEADNMPTAISSPVELMQIVPIDTAYIEATENPYRMKIRYSFADIPLERNHYFASVLSVDEDSLMWDKHNVFNSVVGDEVSKNGNIEGELSYFLDSDFNEAKVRLYHLSPSLVQYLYSRVENFYSEDDPFMEYPIPVFSNISNGYGFFGSYTKDTYTIRLE